MRKLEFEPTDRRILWCLIAAIVLLIVSYPFSLIAEDEIQTMRDEVEFYKDKSFLLKREAHQLWLENDPLSENRFGEASQYESEAFSKELKASDLTYHRLFPLKLFTYFSGFSIILYSISLGIKKKSRKFAFGTALTLFITGISIATLFLLRVIG